MQLRFQKKKMKAKIINMEFFKQSYIRNSFLILIGGVIFGAIVFPNATNSILFGAIICFLNSISGFLAIEYAFKKSQNTFLMITFGMMGARLALMLLAVFFMISFFNYPKIETLLSLFVFYSVYLFFEIFYLQKKLKQ